MLTSFSPIEKREIGLHDSERERERERGKMELAEGVYKIVMGGAEVMSHAIWYFFLYK